MGKKLYKYIAPGTLEKAFSDPSQCGFKFSYPKDYNDPFELFLTINFENDKEIAAFYKEVVIQIPQYPTTCFSKSPTVVPMWAHYAQNSEGFVIEIDEDKLKSIHSDIKIDDVIYRNEPRSEIGSTLQMALYRGKPRDYMFLRNGVQHAAYFTKHTCWEYEQERRMVVDHESIYEVGDNMIFNIPSECVTAIIAGPKAEQKYRDEGRELSETLGCQYFDLIIGKSTSAPFFLERTKLTYIFDGDAIVQTAESCSNCREPTSGESKLCIWCGITEEDRLAAASTNPLRAFHEYGILEEYVTTFNNIGRNK